jgi:hypothetical protein
MIATVVPFILVFIAAVVVYGLIRNIITERRLAALIRRQPHLRQRKEEREFFEEVRTAVARFDATMPDHSPK